MPSSPDPLPPALASVLSETYGQAVAALDREHGNRVATRVDWLSDADYVLAALSEATPSPDPEIASLRAALDECRQHHADTLAGLDPHTGPSLDPTRHEHRPEYPSSCTGCEHLAADLASRLPPGLLPSPDPALDVAWREAEALDAGGVSVRRWAYNTGADFEAFIGGHHDIGPTPTEAIRAAMASLASQTPEPS
jgi:hypothetical protein